ncbi:MAG: O-antigen ligase family protein [Clostridia bacterium]|nr:O-antigen ligase family protein [Clostridia bacterium]
MKNSAIIKFFTFMIGRLLAIYNDSILEKLIDSVCNFFKEKAKGSIFCKFMADSEKSGNYWKNSFVFKAISSNVRFVLSLGNKFKSSLMNSKIVAFLDNILNISIKDYSKLSAAIILGSLVGMALNRGFDRINIILVVPLALITILTAFIPGTIKSVCSSSVVVKIFASLFNRYSVDTEENPIHKLKNLKSVMALLFVVGIIGGMISFVKFIIAIFAVIVVLLILNNTKIGIFLTVILAPIMPTMVCAGIVLLTTVSYYIGLMLGREKSYKVSQSGAFIIGFLAVAFFSSVTSFNISKSVQSFALYFVFALSYFLIVNNIKTKNQWYNLVVVSVLAGLLVGLYGVYQNFFVTATDTSWIDEDMFTGIKTRVYSTFDNPNVLGQYLVMSIPVAFALMWSERKIWAKTFYLGVTAVMGACLIFTWSRAAWIGIILAIGFYMVMKDRRWSALLVVALLIMPFVLPESILSRITSLGNMKDSSTAYRFSVWLSSLRMAGDYWLSGIGLGAGAFERVYQKYALNGAGFALHAHNFYIQLVVEMGILGIVLFAMMIISTYRKIISIKEKKSVNYNVALAMGGAILGYLFQGVAENLWYNYRMILLFFIYLGILNSGANLAGSKPVCTISADGIKE